MSKTIVRGHKEKARVHQAVFIYVKRATDVRKKKWLSGHGIFANRPADTVSSLPSDRRLTPEVWPTKTFRRRAVDKLTQWTRPYLSLC